MEQTRTDLRVTYVSLSGKALKRVIPDVAETITPVMAWEFARTAAKDLAISDKGGDIHDHDDSSEL